MSNKFAENSWKPDKYISFRINDPKPRIIHKASVRDRVLFQAVYRKLYPIFDPSFIFNSYSSRVGKGTHAGVKRFGVFARKLTVNYRKRCFVLKCDIRKFFDSVNHKILCRFIQRKVFDIHLLTLVEKIIQSFEKESGKGLPLGNVTSQLFANIYLNEPDQFIKHSLKAKPYIRYCDDFVILDKSSEMLDTEIFAIQDFCRDTLLLDLHERKTVIRRINQGTDFLGYVNLPHRMVLRTKTKRRILAHINISNLPSYIGICGHAKERRFSKLLEERAKKTAKTFSKKVLK